MVAALRSTLVSQSQELDSLHAGLAALERQRQDEQAAAARAEEELTSLRQQVDQLQREKIELSFSEHFPSQAAPPQQVSAQVAPKVEAELTQLREQVTALQLEKEEAETEQTDLLVLLEELTSKRREDKRRMRQAGLECSEDEDEGDEGDEGADELV